MTYIIYVNSISCIDFLGCNLTRSRRILFQLQFGMFHLIYVAPKVLDAAPVRDEACNKHRVTGVEYSGEDTYHEGKVQIFFCLILFESKYQLIGCMEKYEMETIGNITSQLP